LEPDRTLATQHLSKYKINKEHLLIVLCGNINNSYKLNTLVIRKYKKPRCFKNINVSNLPVNYRSSIKAWIITSLFQEWIKEFDHQVDLQFLLPNTISRIQPMDARVIVSFKRYNRHLHVCFLEDQHQTTDPVFDDIADILEALDLLDPMQIDEFLVIAEENIVYEVFPDDQIITELVETFRTNDLIVTDLEDANDSFEIPVVSANIANTSLKTIYTFLFQENGTEEY
ncbi:21634_t:CDS:2, partial [Racocetra persica]